MTTNLFLINEHIFGYALGILEAPAEFAILFE